MSSNKIIKCDLCGHIFKTFSRVEQHYHDYELEDEICYYPVPEEHAHIVHNYICDDCYHHIGDIVKKLLITSGEKYISELEERKKALYNTYLKEIKELEQKNKNVKYICSHIKSLSNIYDINEQIKNEITEMNSEYPYSSGNYYLENAINIEKELKLNMKSIWDWERYFNIDIAKLSYNGNKSDMVTKDEFKSILMNSEVKGKTLKEIMKLIDQM